MNSKKNYIKFHPWNFSQNTSQYIHKSDTSTFFVLQKLKQLCIQNNDYLRSKFVLLAALLLEDHAKEPLSEQKVPKTW